MARARSLALCGLDRGEESAIRDFFDAAVKRCGIPWALVGEGDADALLIDVDSMYGQMSWLRAQGGSRPIIALTSGQRADADFLLPRPATVEALAGLLGMLAERVMPSAANAAPSASTPAPAAAAPPPASAKPTPKAAPAAIPTPVEPAPAPAAPVVAAEAAPTPEPLPAPPPRPLQLFDYLRDGLLDTPVKLRGVEPPLLIDPASKTYFGGSTLKPWLPVAARSEIRGEHWLTLSNDELQAQAAGLGPAQPLSRLLWLAGLGAGSGELLPELAGAQRFKLGKYPTTEREFPKHIRIATTMLKQLATVDEIAVGSGMERGDVCDFINACHALGLVETDLPAPSAGEVSEPAKGGLLGRLRRR